MFGIFATPLFVLIFILNQIMSQHKWGVTFMQRPSTIYKK